MNGNSLMLGGRSAGVYGPVILRSVLEEGESVEECPSRAVTEAGLWRSAALRGEGLWIFSGEVLCGKPATAEGSCWLLGKRCRKEGGESCLFIPCHSHGSVLWDGMETGPLRCGPETV